MYEVKFYQRKIKSFNFDISECDGHNFRSIIKSLNKKRAILNLNVFAKTIKGKV